MNKVIKYFESKGYAVNKHHHDSLENVDVYRITRNDKSFGSVFSYPNGSMFMVKYFKNNQNEVRSVTSPTSKSQQFIIDFFEDDRGHCEFESLTGDIHELA